MNTSTFVLVIFGATGDLAKNKLIPALFSLFKQDLLPQNFYIVGFARRPFGDDEFARMLSKDPDDEWEKFAQHLYYQQGEFENERGYQKLIAQLEAFYKKIGACITRFFYLATPPQNYETILDFLDSTKLSIGCGSKNWTHLIIEKPFGKDLQTAQMLDKKLSQIFEEKQIFRVDHYLGKETVQNMIAFRFANGIFEPVWNNKYIDHVQITWAEEKGIEARGKFFDGVGMLRDVAQNHLMQLVAAVAMEQPKTFEKEDIRDSRAKVIQAIKCPDASRNAARGQYDGYRNTKDVVTDSNTETYVALKLFIDTPRFSGVPFYLRAGKKMPKNIVEINIVFIQTCHILFKEFGCPEIGNVLTIRIQPDEGIGLRVIVKTPGSKLSLSTVDMKFSYDEQLKTKGADAYEKILLDIFSGDQMLFNRTDELMSSWEFISKILEEWDLQNRLQKVGVLEYKSGSWGPKEADDLIENDKRKWI